MVWMTTVKPMKAMFHPPLALQQTKKLLEVKMQQHQIHVTQACHDSSEGQIKSCPMPGDREQMLLPAKVSDNSHQIFLAALRS